MALKDEWKRLTSGYTQDTQLIQHLWQEIEAAYTAPGRHYHNLQHLTALLSLTATHQALLQEPELVRFAIFYHDIVYNPFAKGNEEKSAELAVARLEQLGLSPEEQEQVRQMILATKNHATAEDADTQLLLDFDLSILGTDWPTYKEYSRQIRKEYSLAPCFLYSKCRKKVLKHFLNMEQIYKTDYLARRWESAARQNMQQELEKLC